MELFRIHSSTLTRLKPLAPKLEREIQLLLEANLFTVFAVRFLASEYSTGEKQAGRIDSLGLDENGTPVIVEYKLSSSENVINQALYYMDWLVDHKGDFELLVQKKLGNGIQVDWTAPRVLCVADSFSRYDTYAVTQMGRNIQLVQYKLFEEGYLSVDVVGGGQLGSPGKKSAPTPREVAEYTVEKHLDRATGALREVAEELREHILGLGEDVTEGPVKQYVAYRTTRNICCLEIHQKHLFVYLTLPGSLAEGCAICRDVTSIGHFGTGNLEVRITSVDQTTTAKKFIDLAYTGQPTTV
jgi:predicted transport protein